MHSKKLDNLVLIHKALASNIRIAILHYLRRNKPFKFYTQELIDYFKVPKARMSRNLRILEDAKLIERENDMQIGTAKIVRLTELGGSIEI